jgi:hypothetical protein
MQSAENTTPSTPFPTTRRFAQPCSRWRRAVEGEGTTVYLARIPIDEHHERINFIWLRGRARKGGLPRERVQMRVDLPSPVVEVWVPANGQRPQLLSSSNLGLGTVL